MPIAYTLRFLSDGSFVSLDVSTSNTVTYCERVANQYRVELESLECITQEDDTGDDDIYNRIRVKASNSSLTHNLWSKPRGQAIAMDDDSSIEIDGSRTFTLPVNINNFYFDVSANLRELDVIGADDPLNGSKRVYLSNIRGGKIININSGDARYKVHFKITPL
jgi:hypothetical protein